MCIFQYTCTVVHVTVLAMCLFMSLLSLRQENICRLAMDPSQAHGGKVNKTARGPLTAGLHNPCPGAAAGCPISRRGSKFGDLIFLGTSYPNPSWMGHPQGHCIFYISMVCAGYLDEERHENGRSQAPLWGTQTPSLQCMLHHLLPAKASLTRHKS